MYATTLFLGRDGAGMATVKGSTMFTLCCCICPFAFCCIVTLEMSSRILSTSNWQFAEALWTKSLSTMTCLNAALNCWGSGLSWKPPFDLIAENKFSKQSWFSLFARCAVPNLKLLVFYSFYFNFSLRTKNKLGCQFFWGFVSGIGFSRYSG